MSQTTKTITLTTEQMFAIEQGLEFRINQCHQTIAKGRPDEMYWRDQLEIAEQALKLVTDA